MNLRALLLAPLACCSIASAHFPWLLTTDDAQVRLFFGESPSDREYHLPEAIAAAEVWQDAIDAPAKPLTMAPHEEEGFLGLEADGPIEPRGVVRSTVTYGLYHGSKLVYHAQHFPAENPADWPASVPGQKGLAAAFAFEGDKLVATVTRGGKPLAGASATLSHADGGEPVSAGTDADGRARFPKKAVREGLNGLMVMLIDKEDSGDFDGKPYGSATHVLTATFAHRPAAAARASALPPLPEAVSSFGAAVSDGWLYVYGGHIGQAHDHSKDNLSRAFRRVRLDGTGGWEGLPAGPPLQGLPLVAYGGKLYCVGGLDARNAAGQKEDLHSVADFAVFDPATNRWSDLAPLPGPRSSHNAVALGDTLYVVGGWKLSGSSDGAWQAGALAFDFNDPAAGWKELPEPPFKRRAIAIGQADGKLVVLGGMTDAAEASRDVFFYDPATRAWSAGPEFPGDAFHGFGLSAWNLDGALYAGGMEGVLYRLSDARDAWVRADDFATKRFFHQLVPDGRGGLLAVAGASQEVGHTGTIERLDLVLAPADADADGAE